MSRMQMVSSISPQKLFLPEVLSILQWHSASSQHGMMGRSVLTSSKYTASWNLRHLAPVIYPTGCHYSSNYFHEHSIFSFLETKSTQVQMVTSSTIGTEHSTNAMVSILETRRYAPLSIVYFATLSGPLSVSKYFLPEYILRACRASMSTDLLCFSILIFSGPWLMPVAQRGERLQYWLMSWSERNPS